MRPVIRLAAALAICAAPASADAPAYWWAQRVVCLPDTVLDGDWSDRCGVSRIGPFENDGACDRLSLPAWRLEAERMVKAGWGSALLGEVECVYRGPPGTVS